MILVSQSSAVPIYGDPPSEDTGVALQVQKWITADAIELNENFTVFVNITNFSSLHPARNLNITEPTFEEFSVSEIIGYDEYQYTEIGPGGTISYSYTLLPIVEGSFTIEPTVVGFVNENGTVNQAYSNYINFNVSISVEEQDNSQLWRTLSLYSFILVGIPIILFTISKFVWRR